MGKNDNNSLKIKGFTRTIDTFDDNQGKQEAGVGVYFQEEFDNIQELKLRYKRYLKERKVRRAKNKIENAERKIKKDSVKVVKKQQRDSLKMIKKKKKIA